MEGRPYATGYAKRVAQHLGRRVDAACVVRPQGASYVYLPIAVLIGSSVAASGVGVIGIGIGLMLLFPVAHPAIHLLGRRQNPPLAGRMVLLLTPDGFELHSLGLLWFAKPRRLLFAASYADVAMVWETESTLTPNAEIDLRSGPTIKLEPRRLGTGRAAPVLAALGRRVKDAPREYAEA